MKAPFSQAVLNPIDNRDLINVLQEKFGDRNPLGIIGKLSKAYAEEVTNQKPEFIPLGMAEGGYIGDFFKNLVGVSPLNVGEEEQLKIALQQGQIPTAPLPKVKPEQKNNFKEQMALSESSNNPTAVNTEGYMGTFQFGNRRLSDFKKANKKKFTKKEFLNNSKLQNEVFNWHVNDINKYINNEKLNSYIGKTIKGILVTRNGLTAVAHLGGKEGMKKFLETGGKYNPKDSNGTSLSDYLNKFK
tara:strand:+ start:8 stop:739 length:732 start_codon:yes stop_codon:yes gene_type:complete